MTADMPDDTAAEARRAARSNLTALTVRLAVEGHGATRHEDPVEGYRMLTRTRLDPPTAGLQAALQVQRLAAGLVHEQAMAARSGGVSWADIGRLLSPESEPGEAAEDAYRHLVWDETLPYESSLPWQRRERRAHWTCGSCGQRITDKGPFGGHPDDVEAGHAETCERHRSAIAAWGDE